MQSWYLIYCKRGQLVRAQANLENQQVRCFTPTRQVEKMIRGKRILTTEVLFPNYLFIEFDPEVIRTTTISATRGVNNFVRFGSSLAQIPSHIMHDLMEKTADMDVDYSSVPTPGDSVEITEGIYAGLQAIYAEPDGETRSILLLNLLNQQVTCSLENKTFKKRLSS